MRLLLRLLAGIWLATLVVIGGLAYLEIRDEQQRLTQDLHRRAALAADAVREASERVVGRGPVPKLPLERILKRFARPDRGVAIYDELAGLLDTSPEMRPFVASVTPLASEAIRNNAPVRELQRVGGRAMLVQGVPLERDDRVAGAVAIALDAEILDTYELALWRRTAVRLGVLILLLTGITGLLVRWTVTRPMARMAEWTTPTGWSACPRTSRPTRCGASGSRPRRMPATTTASPTKGCGRSATSSTSAPSSAPATGSSTAPSTPSSPPRCWRRWRLRGLRHLPVAGADPAGHAGGRHHRLSHAVSLQQGPSRGAGSGTRSRSCAASTPPRCCRFRSAWPPTWTRTPSPPPPRSVLLGSLGGPVEVLGVGMDRVDYTQGLPERFRAIRRFLQRWPQYRRRVTFLQIASPSRTRIPRYQQLQQEVAEIVRRVNEEIGERGWQPIVYRQRHHDHREIRDWYRAADFCLVTSLHDGMNLVAKEFIATRRDDGGVLILSRFAGASRELHDALLVNPYDIEVVAKAIRRAVEMPPAERQERMGRMRAHVREQNIFRWAGMLLSALARMPRSIPARHTGAGETVV